MQSIIDRLKNSEDGVIKLTEGEIRVIITSLKIRDAIDDVLDEQLGIK